MSCTLVFTPVLTDIAFSKGTTARKQEVEQRKDRLGEGRTIRYTRQYNID